MGSKQPRTALVLCRGAYLRPSFKKFPRSRFFISNNEVLQYLHSDPQNFSTVGALNFRIGRQF